MSVKSKLLEEINKKAEKIREKRIEAANNKTIEAAVFEFFKNIEQSRLLHSGDKYEETLVWEAKSALESRLKAFDNRVKISVEYNVAPPDSLSVQEETIRGVTIWWSPAYIKKHNVDPSLYIDVSQMLFF